MKVNTYSERGLAYMHRDFAFPPPEMLEQVVQHISAAGTRIGGLMAPLAWADDNAVASLCYWFSNQVG